jgi:GT2 family glycosyltransferase
MSYHNISGNAAWWWIMILPLNLKAAMKRLVLDQSWVSKHMKAIQFSLTSLPARAMERSRILRVRFEKSHPLFGWLVKQWGQFND